MKMSDIPEEYFKHLISHTQAIQNMAADIKAFHGIDATQEANNAFYTELQLIDMRSKDIELTPDQWNAFWKIINETEANIARARVANKRFEEECKRLDIEHPIQYGQDGWAYRSFRDWDGRPYKEYLEMGG